ncbi:alginate export family protein [Qipengyuania gaetbuli]|uniref:alginate export family protein n=1 Tax=Qipengyuania gaetbuli TaxID=266952 RepID=UPI001CFDFCDB|nr:alginate export family protein [Qipengyuania gaetbuli]
MTKSVLTLAASALALTLPGVVQAQASDPLPVDPYLDILYRLEVVDQEGLTEDATASTMRIKAGVETDEWNGFSALVEGEAIVRLGPEDFNDTVNGRTSFPIVADPSDVLLNQAFVKWRPIEEASITAGRQAINLDNQRWIGSVGWRQNDQTFDAVRASAEPLAGASIDYFHAWRVNRIFGPDSPQGIWRDNDIHGARASYEFSGVGTISAYGYFLDIPDAPAASSQTLGVRLSGNTALSGAVKFLYTGEYARQRDFGPNPADFSLDYLLVEPGVSVGGFIAKVGLERLEGNGVVALQTPLATLHAFNGWADKFLATPPNGLRDTYADLSYRFGDGSSLKGLLLRGLFHDFNATEGSISYGQEWNVLAVYPLRSNVTLLAKFAHYEADAFATDTTKGWLSVQLKF